MDSVFQIIYVCGLVLGSAVRAVYTRGKRSRQILLTRASALDSALLLLAGLGMFAAPILCLTTPWLSFASYSAPPVLGWLGALVFAASIWLLWRSHRDLGDNWSARPDVRHGQELVVTGIYRRIRHPMYAAHWLWALAQALLIPNWVAGPAMLVFFAPLYFVRVGAEEQVMRQHFGARYEAHHARTGRLWPRRFDNSPTPRNPDDD